MPVCPKCKEGKLTSIQFKKSGMKAQLCDFCDALWLVDESISENKTHTLDSYLTENEEEYMIIHELEDQKDHITIYPFR